MVCELFAYCENTCSLVERRPHALLNPGRLGGGTSHLSFANTCCAAVWFINETIEERAGGLSNYVMNLLDNWIHEPYDNSLQHPYFRQEEAATLEIYVCYFVYCIAEDRGLRELYFRVNRTADCIQKLPGSAFLP